jgi:predicted nucleic acid-binding protein
VVRQAILGTELSPTAISTAGLVTRTPQDRQVMADAIRAGARYLITTDVDDFAFEGLATGTMSAAAAIRT